jgi:hypothetical protein
MDLLTFNKNLIVIHYKFIFKKRPLIPTYLKEDPKLEAKNTKNKNYL